MSSGVLSASGGGAVVKRAQRLRIVGCDGDSLNAWYEPKDHSIPKPTLAALCGELDRPEHGKVARAGTSDGHSSPSGGFNKRLTVDLAGYS